MDATTTHAGLLAAGLLTVMPTPLHAQDGRSLPGTFSGNVAIVSDYMVRGISLSNENPAIQGGIHWEGGTWLYADLWGSSVEFGNDASAEIDFSAGLHGALDKLHYEFGFTYYWYPETIVAGQSFWDVHADAGYDFGFSDVTFGIAYTTDDYGPLVNDQTLYYKVGLSLPVAEMMTISGSLGYSVADQRANYSDWNAGATFNVFDWFNLDVRYFDSDNVLICGTLCDARAVVKISRVF